MAVALLVVGCLGGAAGPTGVPIPSPTCGGLRILIDGALPCERVVAIAVNELAHSSPAQVARGITAVDVVLAGCRTGEVPPQVDCAGSAFAQYVTVTFGPAPPGGPIEPSLTVAVEPVSGRVLGVENPLIR